LRNEAASSLGASILLIGAIATAFLTLISYIIITPLVNGATTKAISERYLGNEITIKAAFREAWQHVGTLLLTQLTVSLIVIAGFFLLFVPGILWSLSYALVAPVAVLEDTNPEETRHRSWNLVKGNRGKVFAVMFVIVCLTYLALFGIGFVVGASLNTESDAGTLISNVMQTLISILIAPLYSIAVTLLYYDMRIRKEGFDLEMLSRAVSKPTVGA